MKDLPKSLFFLVLILYPFFSYLVYEGTGMEPTYVFGFICFCFLIVRLYSIYMAGANLVVPYYLIIFGIFTSYIILSSIFVSNRLIESGALKYFYSNSSVFTFIAFLIVENTYFPPRWIKLAIKILGLTLILAAIVSVIQIFDPLFLIKSDYLIRGLSYDRIIQYYHDNPKEVTSEIMHFIEGYRFSIYSYISELSVGIDSIAIFSLLFALKSNNRVKTGILVIAAALVSLVSSARWIMLNFLVVAAQNIWINKNKVLNTIKYGLYGIALLLLLVPLIQFFGIDIQQFMEERLMSKSASTRIYAFEVFSKVYPDHPIFGTGGVDTPEMDILIRGKSSQIHVGYLKLFYYYGLVGGLLYLAFLGTLLTRMWKIARQTNYWGGFFAILAFFIANLTLVQLHLFYYGLLLALVFSNHFYYERSKSFAFSQAKKNNRVVTATENKL